MTKIKRVTRMSRKRQYAVKIASCLVARNLEALGKDRCQSFLLNDSAANVSIKADIAETRKRSRVSGNSGPRGGAPFCNSTCLNASIPNVRGLAKVRCLSAVGMAVTGYMAPERNSMGMTRKFMMMLNPSNEVSRAAIKIPSEVMQNETSMAMARTSKN